MYFDTSGMFATGVDRSLIYHLRYMSIYCMLCQYVLMRESGAQRLNEVEAGGEGAIAEGSPQSYLRSPSLRSRGDGAHNEHT